MFKTTTVLALGLMAAATGARAAEPGAPQRASVDVVFVLDTTSSMTSMIEGAKQRIWAIANEIAKGRPAPRVRMGLVAYRDKGDVYVTKVVDLSDNLDKVYSQLMSFRAEGGGDTPEHVIAGLDDAVEKIAWSTDPKTFKVVYLVGDAPPHEDYPEAPTLASVMEKAVRKGLVVNAVPCGNDPQMLAAFERIARSGEGKVLPVPQDGGMAAVITPYDGELASLSGKLEGTGLAYGSGGARAEAKADASLASSVRAMAAPAAAAERAVYKSRAGFSGGSDLIAAYDSDGAALSRLKEAELPDELQGMSKDARAKKVAALSSERKALKAKLDSVATRRAEWLKKNASTRTADSFDARLTESLRAEGARKGIAY
jgi:Mg-chelatase subunit ChlD